MDAQTKKWLLVGGGVAAVVAIVVLAQKANAAPSLPPTTSTPPSPPPSPPPATPPSTSGAFITLMLDQPARSDGFRLGDSITVQPPAGASWAPWATNPNPGSAPISWTYQGPAVQVLNWIDATGKAQTTTMTLYTVS